MKGRALIAANLKRIRLLRGYSQERLGHDSRVDPTYVWKLEQAKVNPTIDVLDRLAATLDVAVGELLSPLPVGAEEPSPLPRGRRAHRGR